MALIPKFVVVAAEYTVDPNTKDIPMGAFVAISGQNSGFDGSSDTIVRLATTGDGAKIIGVSGDNKSSSASTLPGVSSGFQNRVPDMFNETKASGKLTVYHSGGEFITDQWTSVTTNDIGKYLKVSVAGDANDGTLIVDGTSVTTNSVARLLSGPGMVESGVPGTDINGSTAMGGANSNQYITIKLLV